jgi:NAD(P)-dependent dehydrogenase (short-subunit alcohol dehydrogenase family)/acyl carrier protein
LLLERIKTQQGYWLVFAHEASLTSNLTRRLSELGNVVVTVNAGESFARLNEQLYTIDPQRESDYERLLEELDHHHGPLRNILHLWSVTSEGRTQSQTESVAQLQSLGFYSLLFLAQACGNRKSAEPLQLTVLSNDMQAVAGEECLWPEKATVLGPCKVIPQEYANLSCTSIDLVLPQAGTLQEERLIDQLVAELSAKFSEPVVAFRGGTRWVQRLEAVRIDEVGKEASRLRSRGIYLITGGLGAIGLTLAEHLARSVKARLVLLGRSSFPSRDEWATWVTSYGDDNEVSRKIAKLKMLEAQGAEVLVLSADVADEGQMRESLTRARERFGEINGVIHAAGIPGAGIIQLKTQDAAAAVLSPKLLGTLVIEKIFRETKLDFLVLCSSTSSILGGAGGVDYCAANAFLNNYAQSKWAQGAFTVSIGWHKWLEIGMAANAVLALQPKGRRQIQEGKNGHGGTKPKHSIFDLRVGDDPEQYAYLTNFSSRRHWVLNEHRIRGHAVIPGVAYLEMARAAFAEIAGNRDIGISDAVFVSPLIVTDDEEVEVRTNINKEGRAYKFLIESKRKAGDGGAAQWTAHALGSIDYLTADSAANPKLKDLIATCKREGVLIEGKKHYRELGPRWHNLKKIHFGKDEGIAELELSEEYSADLSEFKLHPSLLDMSTSFLAARFLGEGDYLPFRYRTVRIKAPLPRKVYSYVKYKESGDQSRETVSFDVIIADEHAAELVVIEDFTMKRVGKVLGKLRGLNEVNRAPSKGQTAFPEADTPPPRGATQNPTSQLLAGILPKEGVEAFKRVLLRTTMPQVFVSAQDLPALVEHFNNVKVSSAPPRAVEQFTETKRAYPRPDLGQAYVAPRSEVEETIAGIWRRILGIEQIGVDDNFFDLGGDSLIALQLSSRLRDSFHVEPSLGGIFDSPTVAGLATLVAQSAAESIDSELLAQLLTELEG